MTRNRLISAGNVVDASLPCRRRDTVHSPEVERQQERERAVLRKESVEYYYMEASIIHFYLRGGEGSTGTEIIFCSGWH